MPRPAVLGLLFYPQTEATATAADATAPHASRPEA